MQLCLTMGPLLRQKHLLLLLKLKHYLVLLFNFSQADSPPKPAVSAKPPSGATGKSGGQESDWDSTQAETPRSARGTNKIPLSARVS